MKLLSIAALVLAFATTAQAASVKSARYVDRTDSIVFYGGGCKEHTFKLEVGACLETFPVQCGAKLVDLTNDDFCEALITKKISISLKKAGLRDSYFSGASIGISGDDNVTFTVSLPEISEP
jgi:hypothetical protein